MHLLRLPSQPFLLAILLEQVQEGGSQVRVTSSAVEHLRGECSNAILLLELLYDSYDGRRALNPARTMQ